MGAVREYKQELTPFEERAVRYIHIDLRKGTRKPILSKQELADAYGCSVRVLRAEINEGTIYERLLKVGYKKNQKTLWPRHLEVIYEELGAPECVF